MARIKGALATRKRRKKILSLLRAISALSQSFLKQLKKQL